MIIGHAPSGYLLAYFLRNSFTGLALKPSTLFAAAIIGALIPDLDMLYFHLIDHRQHHHHSYFTHYPIFWLSLWLLSVLWVKVNQKSKNAVLAVVFCSAGFLHLFLDSIVDDIWWLAPFVDRSYAMFTVPALYKPWWLNFIFHWSFFLELALWIYAIYLYRKT